MKNITKRGPAMQLGLGGLLLGLAAPFAAATPEQDAALAEKEFGRGDLIASGALWKKAALEGYAPAQVRFADILDQSEEDAAAVEWYRKAAAQSNAAGEFGLAVMYAKGEGVKKDLAQAQSYMLRSAKQDHLPAVAVLKDAYRIGDLALQIDLAQADAWKARFEALSPPKTPVVDKTKKVDVK